MRKYNYCIRAGGCFWCASKPFYEYEGIDIIKVSHIKEVIDLCIEDDLKQSIDILSAKAKE